jgi:hypothetical protein
MHAEFYSGNLKGRKSLEISARTWMENIKMYLKVIVYKGVNRIKGAVLD